MFTPEHHRISRVAIDGLDASGKGELTLEIASRLGGDTYLIDYPQYHTPWGIVLKHLLTENDEGLNVQDRMLVYALNRLETVSQIRDMIDVYEERAETLNLVFDRFYSSNILTAAYYLAKLNPEERPSDLRQWIMGLYDFMLKIDAEFISTLGLSETKIFVPLLRSEDAIRSLNSDSSREGSDLYERTDVQSIARDLYEIVGREFSNTMVVFSQYDNFGARMTPRQQADYVINYLQVPTRKIPQNPSSFRADVTSDPDRINEILEKYGSDKLKALNPYKTMY